MLKATRAILNVIVALFIVALLALLITGGYSVELMGLKISSNSILPVASGLIVGILLRVAVAIGPAMSALVAVSSIFALGLVEFALRVLNLPLAQPALTQIHRGSDIYGYELIPDTRGVGTLGENISINSLGMRNETVSSLPNRKAIAMLGDSFTFGMGVELAQTFTKQLQSQLSGQGDSVDVLNFGVIGYQLWQYLELLDRRVPGHDVNLVIVALFMDDIISPLPPETLIARNPFAEQRSDKFDRLYLWNMLRNISTRLDTRYRYQRGHDYLLGIQERKAYIGGRKADHSYYKAQTGQLDGTIYADLGTAIRRLANWSRQHHIPLLAALIPDASQLNEPDRQDVNRRLADLMEAVNLPFLDLTPAFEAQRDPQSLFLFPLDAHTSPQGHRLIARQLADHDLVRSVVTGNMIENNQTPINTPVGAH